MFFQKASDPVEEVTVAEVIAVALAEHLQDQRGQAPLHQGLTAVHQHAQAPELLARAAAEVMAAVLSNHHDQAQHGQAARSDKNRAR
jgi:hypothetical protein